MNLFGQAKHTETPVVGHMSTGGTTIGTSSYQHAQIFGPAGIHYRPKNSDKVLILPVDGVNICLGTPCKTDGLAEGEVYIESAGGATLYMKNNGEVVINGMRISSNGKIV